MLTTHQKVLALFLIFAAVMVIPLSAGLVLVTQLNRSGRQVNAQVLATPAANKCDLNRDGIVDSKDVEIAKEGFGKVTAEKNNQRADVIGQGWINSAVLGAISSNDPTYCK